MRSNGQAFHAIHLFPADLASFVLFLQPAHQWFEVFHHRASGDVSPVALRVQGLIGAWIDRIGHARARA